MAAKHSRFEYEVRGRGRFPIDMLRYDGAYPTGQRDAARIESTYPRFTEDALTEPVTVMLTSTRMPTNGRWASFGWRVLSVVETRNAGTASERTVRHESPMTLGM